MAHQKKAATMSSDQITPMPNVLVVEDEFVLRMRAVDIVEDAGFAAIEAVNADDALKILEARSDISLLFTDIQMPGTLDGLKLAHAVHKRWPEIGIVLVSGQVKLADADKPENSRFFGKPLASRDMIAEIQDMIGSGTLKIAPLNAAQETLTAENDSLRLLLEQAGIDAKALLAQAGIDAKEREAADKLQQLILDELHHRIKNTLAIVSAITAQSLRNATSIAQGKQAIDGRLEALARAHDLLMQVSWANASLAHTLRGATEPYASQDSERFSITGPDIKITSGAVIALAMTVNELCTNTTKFGALSVPGGHVDIVWTVDEETKRLVMIWTEKNGPPVAEPSRRSFGTRLMGSLGLQLHGHVKLAYEPTGFVYTLDVPLGSLIS
jgi:two-component sensor histidine kinase/ActR/RegA family two-component response regulator